LGIVQEIDIPWLQELDFIPIDRHTFSFLNDIDLDCFVKD
jgi:hypothetical protein